MTLSIQNGDEGCGFVQLRVDPQTKQRWVAHIKNTGSKYTSITHFLKDAADYKMEADVYFLNKVFGFTGPRSKDGRA